ncbi:AMP-binding protein, partial [Paractinoplanes brasiliensis]
QLNTRVNRTARILADKGAGPGQFVAVTLPRSVDLLVSLLAVLKTGAAFLPIDVNYPADRVAHMLDDVAPVLTLSEPVLDEGGDPTNLARRVPAAAPAYVIFTSGSTGRPKGVVVPRAALDNFLFAMRRQLPLAAGDQLLAVTTIGFDIAGLELFLPLTVGATVVLADRDTARDPA